MYCTDHIWRNIRGDQSVRRLHQPISEASWSVLQIIVAYGQGDFLPITRYSDNPNKVCLLADNRVRVRGLSNRAPLT